MSSWGNPDGVAPDSPSDVPPSPDVSHPEFCCANIPPGCLTSGILLLRHSTRMSHIQNSSPPTFHPDILRPMLDAGWERRAFQLPRSNISGSSDSAYLESFAANFAQCRGVLLKLPDIGDRHFEIFFFRYLRYFSLDI